MLQKYLESKGHEHLITEYENNGILKLASKKAMVQCVTSYLIDTHSLHPKHSEIVDVCSTAVELFPVYKMPQSQIGGIVNIALIIVLL